MVGDASIYFQAMRVRALGEEPLWSQKKVADWSTQHEVLFFFSDTDELTVSLPIRKSKELKEKLAQWTCSRETATVKGVLVLAAKLYQAALVARPGRCFMRRLLQLCELHLNGDEVKIGGNVWGRHRKKGDAKIVFRMTHDFLADVAWWRCYLILGEERGGERLYASIICLRYCSQERVGSLTRRSASLGACVWKREFIRDMSSQRRSKRGRPRRGRWQTSIVCQLMCWSCWEWS